MKARLAYSKFGIHHSGVEVNFTPRGRQVDHAQYLKGFVRLKGKTITGFLYTAAGVALPVFYAEGINAHVASKAIEELKAAA